MIIGIPTEIKTDEYRVSMAPFGVDALVASGHTVLVQAGAGGPSGLADAEYRDAGGEVVDSHEEIFARADLILKVKEPQPQEVPLLREGQILFTYLHLAAFPELTKGLLERGVTAIAYETITDRKGGLPLLTPMSEIAGRMAVQVGAHCLERPQGGSGVLLAGAPGVPPGVVVIIGGGIVGINAARIARGLGAQVEILEANAARCRYIDDYFHGGVRTLLSTPRILAETLTRADLVVGAVLIPGASAPKLVRRVHLPTMRPGSVIADVAVDQGGCTETTRPTTHRDPTYEVDGIVHYCVANMPGAVPRTATFALSNVTLPYAQAIARDGVAAAVGNDLHLAQGLNVAAGQITHPAVAESLGYEAHAPTAVL